MESGPARTVIDVTGWKSYLAAAMRPYQTVIVVVLVILAVVYFTRRREESDPAVERFVNCYVELALMHELGDTAATVYEIQKDSLLAEFGFDERSFQALKEELDGEPGKLVDAWLLIEERLQERREETQVTE
jgi:hypothetical protein